MKALFLVDVQNEFIEPIPYVDKMILLGALVSKIQEYRREELPIVTTMDSHNKNHYEFIKHGEHCIAGSEGEKLHEHITRALKGYHKHYIVKKDSYSSFYNTNMSNTIKNLDIKEAEVGGVLTSICVMNLVLDLVNRQIPINIIPCGTFDYKDKNKKALIIMKDWVGVTSE